LRRGEEINGGSPSHPERPQETAHFLVLGKKAEGILSVRERTELKMTTPPGFLNGRHAGEGNGKELEPKVKSPHSLRRAGTSGPLPMERGKDMHEIRPGGSYRRNQSDVAKRWREGCQGLKSIGNGLGCAVFVNEGAECSGWGEKKGWDPLMFEKREGRKN